MIKKIKTSSAVKKFFKIADENLKENERELSFEEKAKKMVEENESLTGKPLVLNTFENFNILKKLTEKKDAYIKNYYHSSRWEYTRFILLFLKTLNVKTVLECGSYLFPYYKNSDLLDIKQFQYLKKIKYVMDIRNTPLPIEDKYYDLFISTNMWEHLVNDQQKCFKEVMRISKKALLAIPYMWKSKEHKKPSPEYSDEENIILKNHIGIDHKRMRDWTCNTPYKWFKKVWKIGIYYYEFDD
jgi:hypothetical protein